MLPFMQKKSHESRLVVDGALNAQSNARIKVEQDITFLTDRIAAMRAHPRPNEMLIEHYQSMLKSRESVLKWLLDGCDDETSNLRDQPDQRSA